MSARERYLARYARTPAHAAEVAETALGLCLRHVSDPAAVELSAAEQELLYGLLLAMLEADDAREALEP